MATKKREKDTSNPPPALRDRRRRPYTAAFRPGRSIPAFGLREVVISAHGRLRDGP